jgi:outer membrane protein
MAYGVPDSYRAYRPQKRTKGVCKMLSATMVLLLAFQQQSTNPNAPLRLTLKRAVAIAVEGNAGVRIAAELAQQAGTRVGQARAALLPNLDARVSVSSQTRNLEALGLRIASSRSENSIPRFVGPFKVFDARATGLQSIFDLAALRRYQASKVGRAAALHGIDIAAEVAAAAVAHAYVEALRADAELNAVRENTTLAEAILKQAEELKESGTGTGMEITRAQVQRAHERQRLITVENEGRRARLQLVRAMGLGLETEVTLDDTLEYRNASPQTMNEAVTRALGQRPDYRAQLQRESKAKLATSATKLESAPSVSLFGDYGSIGTSVNNSLVTRTYGFNATIPIFDGGRRDARRAEAASQYRAEQVRTADLASQIALEIRIALDALRSADQEVVVAREGLQLAEAELEQARRRYSNGVAASIEVTQVQTEVARARDDLVLALFHHVTARMDLGQATGTLRTEIE